MKSDYFNLFVTFFKIGLFTIGGGYAMIPLIQEEVVRKNGWVGKEEFVDLLAVSQSAPGVFAVNISIFIGYRLRGVKGGLCCAVANVLPSILIILSIALFFQRFRENETVETIFKGLRPAVVALIAAPLFNVARSAHITRKNIWIPLLAALLIVWWGLSPVYVIIAAGVGGLLWGKMKGRI